MKRYRMWLMVALSAMALAVSGCGGSSNDQKAAQATKSESITVSAAASLQAAANELKDNFIKSRHLDPTQITLNFGGSGTLRQQIEMEHQRVFLFLLMRKICISYRKRI